MREDVLRKEDLGSNEVVIKIGKEEFEKRKDFRAISYDNSMESFKVYRPYSDDPGRFVRNGNAYDIDSTEPVAPTDAARAAKVREELGDFVVTDLSDRPVYKRLKRVFDVVFSGAVLVCFSWLYLLIALLVKIDDPKGPVFFKQRRVGMNGVEFDMLKFRSMCVDAEARLVELKELNEKTGPVFKIADDPRITPIGCLGWPSQ